ncbi:MAG: DNA polymerase III subunit alpha [Crocinitomicaceae bacterium]|nr:DNA polymerase III subunit alpha [Crocinitomicaceae bacterium]MCF8443678.1 DNA polymerase III subunit alpha [Crocinitomicaceae bacterium]
MLHSYFSIKYGVLSPEELIDWAFGAGYSYAVLTDINHTGSGLSFVRRAQEKKIQPILGVDVRNGMDTQYILIAQNKEGFFEINQFITAHIQQEIAFSSRPPELRNCYVVYPFGKIPPTLLANEFVFFQPGQNKDFLIAKYPNLRKRILALQPMTFRHKRDFNAHRLLRSIANNTLLSKLSKAEQAHEQERLISYEAWQKEWEDYPDIFFRTDTILKSCHIQFSFGEQATPQNKATYTENKEEDMKALKSLCEEGLSYRYGKASEDVLQRMDKEIQIIAQKDYLSYFLITRDFTSYARSKGYFYVGRGSGANSLVAYLLRITDVDPIELDLYFERFINLFRKNPPDFDIDFSWRDRDDVIDYIFERFPHATLLCTYNTFQFKATIRELGKVFGLPKEEIDKLVETKMAASQLDEVSGLVLKYSKYIQGLPSHLSIHAGGIIISEKPIHYYSATFLPPKGYPTTQFSMLEAEEVGLFKFDVLSQRGLGKIHDCLDIIRYNQPQNPPHDIHDVNHFKTDIKVRDLLLNAQALGCFYVESPAMRMLMIKLKVQTYLDLVAASSIIRPGVSQSGMMREYILRHLYPERRKQANPILLAIMPETYGVMVYQEDVIKVAHHFAGLSLADADVLRRGMSGKFRSREEFQQVRSLFFTNCLAKGHPNELTAEIWRQIESFAGYAFSKGHSASYAVESYQSLYLKAYYPLEYLTATINNFGGYYRTEVYVHEARKWGAIIEPPCMNEGSFECVLKGNRLILGCMLINGIESKTIITILKERSKNGSFLDFDDLMKRVSIPLEQLVLLIRIDAFRSFPENKKNMLWRTYQYYQKAPKRSVSLTLFEEKPVQFTLPLLAEDELETAFEEMELLGFPLRNPFDLVSSAIDKHILAQEFTLFLGQRIETFGYLSAVKKSYTSKGEVMFFGTFIDIQGGTIDTVHFPESGRKFPFRGRGVYQLKGIITEEFGFYTIEVGEMNKMHFMEDARFRD